MITAITGKDLNNDKFITYLMLARSIKVGSFILTAAGGRQSYTNPLSPTAPQNEIFLTSTPRTAPSFSLDNKSADGNREVRCPFDVVNF